jgi:trans-aconitate methyltransferase
VTPGQAVEIGFGDGTETLALLDRGWRVTAIDPTDHAAAVLRERVPPGAAEQLEIQTTKAEEATIPPFDLLYAGYALSFIDPAVFPTVWRRIRESLRPGGWIVVNVFGVHDTWADDPAMTFIDRPTARRLVRGLDAVSFVEEDQDGDSFGGPKHWHLFDIVARRPWDARP